MSDGSNLGITARRALGTILGGDDQPSEDERLSDEETRARVMAAPLPGEGPTPWQRAEGGEIDKDDAYSMVADSLAHAFLVIAEGNPEILTERQFYTEDDLKNMGDGPWVKDMLGKPKDPTAAAWEAFKERWPEGDEWIGGASGFQVGFAFNLARHLQGLSVVGNPAIVTVGG